MSYGTRDEDLQSMIRERDLGLSSKGPRWPDAIKYEAPKGDRH